MLYVHFTLYFWYQTHYQTSIRKMTDIYSVMLQDVENIYTQQLWTITKIDKYWKRVTVFWWEYCMAQWTQCCSCRPGSLLLLAVCFTVNLQILTYAFCSHILLLTLLFEHCHFVVGVGWPTGVIDVDPSRGRPKKLPPGWVYRRLPWWWLIRSL